MAHPHAQDSLAIHTGLLQLLLENSTSNKPTRVIQTDTSLACSGSIQPWS